MLMPILLAEAAIIFGYAALLPLRRFRCHFAAATLMLMPFFTMPFAYADDIAERRFQRLFRR
jgi:hypothetical protein